MPHTTPTITLAQAPAVVARRQWNPASSAKDSAATGMLARISRFRMSSTRNTAPSQCRSAKPRIDQALHAHVPCVLPAEVRRHHRGHGRPHARQRRQRRGEEQPEPGAPKTRRQPGVQHRGHGRLRVCQRWVHDAQVRGREGQAAVEDEDQGGGPGHGTEGGALVAGGEDLLAVPRRRDVREAGEDDERQDEPERQGRVRPLRHGVDPRADEASKALASPPRPRWPTRPRPGARGTSTRVSTKLTTSLRTTETSPPGSARPARRA